jgi:hypothetical protein
MPRFFFHHRTKEKYIKDPEGQDLPTLEDARLEAIESARELMSEEVLNGSPPDGSQFDISDEQGNVLAIVPFQSALQHK